MSFLSHELGEWRGLEVGPSKERGDVQGEMGTGRGM